MEDFPHDFRCPISMELMKEPVTISTGVTYDRKNIEKWFQTYSKKTCPATMQSIDTFDVTPNHTLKRLIDSWLDSRAEQNRSCSTATSTKHDDQLLTLLSTIQSTPFKVTSLKKLRAIFEGGEDRKEDFKRLKGVETLVDIIVQILVETGDFVAFRACEEALSVLNQVPLMEDDEPILKLLMSPESMKSLAFMLQNGSADARFDIVSIFRKIAKADYQFNYVAQEQGIDFFKSLLEIVSDEICTKANSCALQVLLEILEASKKARLKTIEAGGVCTLIELLPDASRSRCERILMILKCLCECAEGRLAFIEHGLGIAAVSKKLMNVSIGATKTAVKVMWLVASFHGTERVVEDMLVCGAVKKMVALLHVGGGGVGGTKGRVVKVLKMHGGTWRRYPCFPTEWKVYLGLGNDYY